MPHPRPLRLFPTLALLFWSGAAAAQEPGLSDGDTAWIITATALVLFMTLPGLALFYGGLVRSKNLLSVLMHCFSICCLVSVLWLIVGYSLAFGDGGPVIGGLDEGLSRRRRHRRPRGHDSRDRLLHVPDDLRDHHAGADRRRLSPSASPFRRCSCSAASGCSWSTSRSRTGSGAAAGSRRWASWTSPAAWSCTSPRAPRRWSSRW